MRWLRHVAWDPPSAGRCWKEHVSTAGRHHLPSGLNSLPERDRELAEVVRLLQTNRPVTLTGAGGVGKTRLALGVAARAVDTYPNGVWLATLVLNPTRF